MKVPLCKMYLDKNIINVTKQVLISGRYINGPQALAFEEEFANYIGTKYGVSVNSGTSALYVAFMALNFQPGDEFIVPSHTFIASASQAIQQGLKPIFVDSNPKTYTMDVNDVKQKITKKTKAIVAVHIYGHPVDMDPILEIAKEYNLKIIEDCAQSHGSKYKGRMTGSIGDVSCFSFFPSKIMNVGGDGGMILTNDEKLAKYMQMLKNHGRSQKYKSEVFAMNMRMPEIPAAIGRVQLRLIDKFIAQRNRIVDLYNSHFSNIKQIQNPKKESWADPAYYAYVIQVDQRDKFQNHLKERGIETGVHYPIPLHQQELIKRHYNHSVLPYTEAFCKRIVTLPLSGAMTMDQAHYVIKHVKKFFS